MASPSGLALPRCHPSRAESSVSSIPPLRVPSFKRQRDSDSPVYISSAPCTSPVASATARRMLFDALEMGIRYPGKGKHISSADHLSEMQLAKCFDILHACGKATDVEATLSTTRQSIEGFLDAIFNHWTSSRPGYLLRPELDFLVEAQVVAGRICVAPREHRDISCCTKSGVCNMDVSAAATYSSNPAMLKLEFSTVDPLTKQPETLCPIGRGDIKWVSTDWNKNLRQTLRSRIVAKMHKFNKHLAIWHVRKLIVAWSMGSISMAAEAGDVEFLTIDAARMATMDDGQ